VYEVTVNHPQSAPLDRLVEDFATRGLQLALSDAATDLVADPVLVLGPAGTAPVPLATFLEAIAARAKAVSDSPQATTTVLAGCTGQALGERMVIATIRWAFHDGDRTNELVSDFVLERSDRGGLRCVAYLPRTNVTEHLT
jgi:hypothetical protein